MNAVKQTYLQSIRGNTTYPVYRGVVNTVAALGYLLAAAVAIVSLIGAFVMSDTSTVLAIGVLVTGGLFAAVLFMLAKLAKEASLILVDLADSTVDANAQRLAH